MAPGDPPAAVPAFRTSVEVGARGELVVHKRPQGPRERRLAEHEARMLEAARHPGVVELLAGRDPSGEPAVVTRWAGPRTMADARHLTVAHVAGAVAATADVVADLHEIGVVHGALEPDHVILAPDGRPVLCSFGRSVWAGTSDDGPVPGDDVVALGRLLRALIGDVGLEPIPDRRRWLRRPGSDEASRRILLNLADEVVGAPAQTRRSARSLAASIYEQVPDAHLAAVVDNGDRSLPGPPSGRPSHRDHDQPPPGVRPPPAVTDGDVDATTHPDAVPRGEPPVTFRVAPAAGVSIAAPRAGDAVDDLRPRQAGGAQRPVRGGRWLAIVAGVVVLLGIGATQLRPSPVAAPERAEREGQGASAASSAGPADEAAPPPAARAPGSPPTGCGAVAAPMADVDGDGCPDPVRFEESNVVVTPRQRYTVGQTGDHLAVGDWNCDGRATPAVLRPETGEVFVFPAWTVRQEPITVRSTATVPGATAIVGPDDGGVAPCGRLVVHTVAGRDVVVETDTTP